MATSLFFFAANIVALAANLLLGMGLLISNPRSFNARVFAGVTISSGCYLIGRISYAVPADVQIAYWFWPYLLILMNVAPGLWMILAYSLFQDGRLMPRWMTVAFLIQMTLSSVNAFAYVGRDNSVLQSEAFHPVVNFIFGSAPIAMQAAFGGVALYWAVRGWRVDLDESRRILRGVFVFLFGGLFVGISLTEFVFVNASYETRAPFDNALTLLMAVGYVTVTLIVLRFDHRVLERLAERKALLDDRLERDAEALTRACQDDKVFLTPGLTIGGLAQHLAMPEYRLRRVINQRLGYRNFNAFLHEYRLREACERLANPASKRLPILSIALDVGYQSIAPFNQAFREAVGCTPSEFRDRNAGPN